MLWKYFSTFHEDFFCSPHIKEMFGVEDSRRLYLWCPQYLFLWSSSPRTAIAAVRMCRFRADRFALEWIAEHSWHPHCTSFGGGELLCFYSCFGLLSWQVTYQSHFTRQRSLLLIYLQNKLRSWARSLSLSRLEFVLLSIAEDISNIHWYQWMWICPGGALTITASIPDTN